MAYLCYTPDMVKQIDDICSKYNLELLGPTYTANASTEIYTMLGFDSITAPGAGSGVNLGSGYYYRNGSFNLEGSLELADGDGILPGGVIFEYRCIKKTAFDAVALNIGDTESYDQWNYTTSDGTEVLLYASIVLFGDGTPGLLYGIVPEEICNFIFMLVFLSASGLVTYYLKISWSLEKPSKEVERSVIATVISKEVKSGTNETGRSMMGYSFAITFLTEDGQNLELYSYEVEYGGLKEGMKGVLTYQGRYFVNFDVQD